MSVIRPFLNSDVPLLVDLWQRQTPLRGLACGVTASTFEEIVLSRPWFDPAGLMLAWADGLPTGFVHAGFVPAADGASLNHKHGVISQLRTVNHPGEPETAARLLQAALDYLSERGAVECHAVSRYPVGPFYLGLYGGSRLPGVLADDLSFQRTLLGAGFRECGQIGVFQKPLAGFRGLVDRRTSAVKRQFELRAEPNPAATRWWDAGQLRVHDERTRYVLFDRTRQEVVASLMAWDMEPLASCQGIRAAGLFDLRVADQHRRAGLATCLLSETMRVLAQDQVAVAEIQINLADHAGCGVIAKLGYQQVDLGLQMMRTF